MSKQEITTSTNPNQMILERFEDYAILVELNYSHVISFTISEISGWDENDIWLYKDVNEDFTSDFNQAERFLTGDIKWDGCSNWDFHTQECMAHFCGRNQATGIGRLMDHLYQIAKERLSTYDVDLAEDVRS